MEDILGSWKRFSARRINKSLGRPEPLWQREYWDRPARGERKGIFWVNPPGFPAGGAGGA
jgi:hypothetical protein